MGGILWLGTAPPGRQPGDKRSIRLSIVFPLPSPGHKTTPMRYPHWLSSPRALRGLNDSEAIDTCSHAKTIGCHCGTGPNPWSNVENQPYRRRAHHLTRPDYKAGGIDTMNIDEPVEISATKASGGVKLHAMRYVLGISIALAAVAGVILWNMFATR
jgi:hypothetical protein